MRSTFYEEGVIEAQETGFLHDGILGEIQEISRKKTEMVDKREMTTPSPDNSVFY